MSLTSAQSSKVSSTFIILTFGWLESWVEEGFGRKVFLSAHSGNGHQSYCSISDQPHLSPPPSFEECTLAPTWPHVHRQVDALRYPQKSRGEAAQDCKRLDSFLWDAVNEKQAVSGLVLPYSPVFLPMSWKLHRCPTIRAPCSIRLVPVRHIRSWKEALERRRRPSFLLYPFSSVARAFRGGGHRVRLTSFWGLIGGY